MNKKDHLNYKQAIEELEKIVKEIENGETDIDLLAEKVKRATFLSQFCKNKLRKTQEELEKFLDEIEKESGKQIEPPFDSDIDH